MLDPGITLIFLDVLDMLMVWFSLVFCALLAQVNVYISGNLILRLATDTELCKSPLISKI